MKFLDKIITDLLHKDKDLSNFSLVLPGKRPVVFIKRILAEKQYSGFLPSFYTIEELIKDISGKHEIKSVSLWLFAFQTYKKLFSDEDFASFLKWFPTILKDWDDMMKFSENSEAVLEYMLAEERIKNWAENLQDEQTLTQRKHLNFWKKMQRFLPQLQKDLEQENLATSGMIHISAKENLSEFIRETKQKWIFCGFNAFTPLEEKLVRELLSWDKAECFFQADEYYVNDERQEAGVFIRKHLKWKEFNDYRSFNWIENDFTKAKNINVYEVPGNISQTKILPKIFENIPTENYSNTAIILLDENLLPASLDALGNFGALNITMGFPLKNLAFSNAIKKLFYIQKQQEKKAQSYYYADLLAVVEALPNLEKDSNIAKNFEKEIQKRNLIYLSEKRLKELLGDISYLDLFLVKSAAEYLQNLINFCENIKTKSGIDDILFENISLFEKVFKTISNQIAGYDFEIKMETLEILINQLINNESIDFVGEPLQGLQVMGLLETRLLNFQNIILVSVNEGKLPLGNTQNTYLPFNVRDKFNMHTFLDNDSIYAYHFYRLLQNAEQIHLLYNALSSGINTGEKSRFITQIEMESNMKINHFIIENASNPVQNEPILIPKTSSIMQGLEEWKNSVSASHLTSYLYNPIQFYLNYILKTTEGTEMEEELSQRNYGNIVHYTLENIYSNLKGKKLTPDDLSIALSTIDEAMSEAIKKLHHEPEYYKQGMNFVHKSIAQRVVRAIIEEDLRLVSEGKSLEIIDIERKIEDIEFKINDKDIVYFKGFIDRIDCLDGVYRIIDYKTAKSKKSVITFREDNIENIMWKDDCKQALQLCIYMYYLRQSEFKNSPSIAGIWSFAEVNKAVQEVSFENGDLDTAMISIKNLISEILNPEIPFEEKVRLSFNG